MKKVFFALHLLLSLALAGAAGGLVWRMRALRYANDCLEDDKAAFALECSRLEGLCAEKDAELRAVQDEKEALGRNLVAAMKACDKFKADAVFVAAERDKAVRELSEERSARVAAERRAVAQAERDRLEREARAPLRVEQLKPLDPKAREKSDADSLDELLQLTTPSAAGQRANE